MFPDNTGAPPLAVVYQSMVSLAPGVAVILMAPLPQRELLPAAGAPGKGLMVTGKETLAVAGVAQAALLVTVTAMV